MSLCKGVCFYTRTGRTMRVCVERAGVSVTRRVPVCSSACFCGLNPRTVPHRSLNKFRAPLGNRGLVLGLNVSCFFRSLGTSNGARAEQTRPSRSRRHNYVTKNKIAGSAAVKCSPFKAWSRSECSHTCFTYK